MEQKWTDPTPVANLVMAMLILIQTYILLGKVDSTLTSIAVFPWVLVGIPLLLAIVVVLLRVGDICGACATGLVGVVLLGQFIGNGLIPLLLLLTGKTLPPAFAAGAYSVTGMGFLVAGIFLLFLGFLGGFQSKVAAIATWCAAIGFFCLFAVYILGASPIFALVGGIGLLIIAVWLLYSGIAIMVNVAAQKPIMPLGKPLFRAPEAQNSTARTI